MQDLSMTKHGMEQTLKILDGIKALTDNAEIKAGIGEPNIEHLVKYCQDMRKATNTALSLIANTEKLDKDSKTKNKAKAKAKTKPAAPVPEPAPVSDEDFDFLD